jgi:hypothetical protein
MKMGTPLTRPTTADENAVAGHPLPQGGEGSFYILIHSGESKDHEVFARNDTGLVLRRMTGSNSFTGSEAFRKSGGGAVQHCNSPTLTRPWVVSQSDVAWPSWP